MYSRITNYLCAFHCINKHEDLNCYLRRRRFKIIFFYYLKSITVAFWQQDEHLLQYYHKPTINTEFLWFHFTVNMQDDGIAFE